MKKRNKVLIGSGMVLFLSLIVGFGLVAGSSWGNPGGGFPCPFPGRGFHSPALHKDMAQFILWRMDKLAGTLNLNAMQRTKFEELKTNISSRLSTGFEERRQMRARFLEEMNKENPDVRGLVDSAKNRINDFSGFLSTNLELLADFYDSLDSGQKQLLNKEIRERMPQHTS